MSETNAHAAAAETVKIRVLTMGLDARATTAFEADCPGAEFVRITTGDDFMAQYEAWADDLFSAIICGSALEGMSSLEAAQVLLNQCPNTIKFYVTSDTANYEPRNLLKNGFSQCFIVPMDANSLKRAVNEKILSNAKKLRSYRSVRLLDLDAGSELGFDTFVFLPLNKKYVRYTGADQKIDGAKLEKLQAKQMSQVFVDHKDMAKFYQYSANRMHSLGEGGASSTEKQEKLRDCVRGLFNDIFDVSLKADFDAGKEMLSQTEGIISNYITKGATSNWYKKLLAAVGESQDTYDHSSNVATFAALFAIGIGHPNPEDLAMAGMFHDVGIAALPPEIQEKSEADLNEAEKLIFFTHAEKSANAIKSKRLILSDKVEKAILQHHEKFNGKGFPKGLAGNRLSDETQILSFADQFDELTRVEEGKKRVLPLEAFETIKRSGSINPDILSKIKKLLEKQDSVIQGEPGKASA